MNHKNRILEKLLDKYEERKNGSNRRVLLQCSKREAGAPDIESEEYVVFLEQMKSLRAAQLIDFDWIRKNHIIDHIWLNLNHVQDAYAYVNRETMTQQVQNVVQQIDNVLPGIQINWIVQGLEEEKKQLLERNKRFGIWKQPPEWRGKWLDALCYIDRLSGNVVTMRACSVKLYSDSKYFEREIKKTLALWIREHEPILRETEELEEREILSHVGILMMPEVFEFCGNIQMEFSDGLVDFSPMKVGSCILASCVQDIRQISLNGIHRILFIENRTNYAEYCIREKTEDELVVYHGGFYSPQHGEFFRKLHEPAKQIPVYFWADIDYGGFQMFHRLKSNIILDLQPYRMDVKSFDAHKSHGLNRSEAYFQKLSCLLALTEFSMFHPVITQMLKEKITIEQEIFLL